MEVWIDDVLEHGHRYKLEFYMPRSPSKGAACWAYIKMGTNLRAIDIGEVRYDKAGEDKRFLTYYLKVESKVITHRDVFIQALKPAYEGIMWIMCEDLGLEEVPVIHPILQPVIDIPREVVSTVNKNTKTAAIDITETVTDSIEKVKEALAPDPDSPPGDMWKNWKLIFIGIIVTILAVMIIPRIAGKKK